MENIFLLVIKFAAGEIRLTLTLRGAAPIPYNCQLGKECSNRGKKTARIKSKLVMNNMKIFKSHEHLWSEKMHFVKLPGCRGVIKSCSESGGTALSGEAALRNARSKSFYLLFWVLGSRDI